MQKGFPLILIALAVAISGYFLYQQQTKTIPSPTQITTQPSPTSNETANWKTYSNSALGFSFSYPMILDYLYDQFGFNHPDNPEGNLLLQNYDGSKPKQEQSTDFQMVVETYKNSGQVTLDQYVKDPNKVWNQGGVQTFTNITLGNEPALKGLAIQKNEKVPAIWVSHKGYILTIYLATPKSTNASLFDQILPTFQFTSEDESQYNIIKTISPSDNAYKVIYKTFGDGQKIAIQNKSDQILFDDIISLNNEAISRNMKRLGLTGAGQIGFDLMDWKTNTTFTLRILSAEGSEFETVVDAITGKVDESTFKKIK